MRQYPDIPVGVSMLGQPQLEAGIGRHRLCRHDWVVWAWELGRANVMLAPQAPKLGLVCSANPPA
jgi:hypothetical protein